MPQFSRLLKLKPRFVQENTKIMNQYIYTYTHIYIYIYIYIYYNNKQEKMTYLFSCKRQVVYFCNWTNGMHFENDFPSNKIFNHCQSFIHKRNCLAISLISLSKIRKKIKRAFGFKYDNLPC